MLRSGITAILLFGWMLICLSSPSVNAQQDQVHSIDSLRNQVNHLRDDDVPWRQIQWRTCLVDGINESRESGKPLILWIFIDRPVDDERC